MLLLFNHCCLLLLLRKLVKEYVAARPCAIGPQMPRTWTSHAVSCMVSGCPDMSVQRLLPALIVLVPTCFLNRSAAHVPGMRRGQQQLPSVPGPRQHLRRSSILRRTWCETAYLDDEGKRADADS